MNSSIVLRRHLLTMARKAAAVAIEPAIIRRPTSIVGRPVKPGFVEMVTLTS